MIIIISIIEYLIIISVMIGYLHWISFLDITVYSDENILHDANGFGYIYGGCFIDTHGNVNGLAK
jgi:hypothetical protein